MNWFSKYSFKQKNFALLVIFALLLAVTYKRALKPTLEILTLNEELISKKENAVESFSTLLLKKQELKNIDKLIGKEGVTSDRVQQGLLSFHSNNADKSVFVHQINEPFFYIHPDFYIYSNRMILKGEFNSLQNFIYKLETEFDMAKIVSIIYEKEFNYSTSSNELFAHVLLQNFEKK